eukprot:COSAG02_NODE_1437_length_12606_cov_5.043336_1_plen_784_part_00
MLAAGREASDAGGEWRAVAAVLRRLGLWWLVRRGLVCVCVCVCERERERESRLLRNMTDVAPRSNALIRSRLPKAKPRSSPPNGKKPESSSPNRRLGLGGGAAAQRSNTPSNIPVARGGGHSSAAAASMARMERQQRMGVGRECSSSEDDEQRAPLQERNGVPQGPSRAGPASVPMERPVSAAGPRPGTASSVADVDPQYQGELSSAAIAAAAHQTDPTKIYELKLRGAAIEKIENLGPLRKLRHLDLSGNHIARIEGLESLGDLRELKVFANRLSSIEGLDNCGNLRLLSLQHNQIMRIDGLQKLTKLQQLRLDGNLIEKIENLSPNTALTHLNLSGNRIQRVEGMLSLALLEELLLNDNEIVVVSKVPGRALLELSLANNKLGEPFEDPMPGAKARSCLAGLAAAKKLTALDLSGNQLTGELGSQLPKMLALETLNLDNNRLELLGGMADLCPVLALLELRGNEISHSSLGGSLAEGVTELAVSGNPLTYSDTWRVDVCRNFSALEQLDEAVAEHGAAGSGRTAGGVGARPGTAGARGAGNAPIMRPPSATTEALSTLIAPEALESTAAGLSARLAALKLTLSAGDSPRAWVQTLPKSKAVSTVDGGAIPIQQPPAALVVGATDSKEHLPMPLPAGSAEPPISRTQISGADLKAELLAEDSSSERGSAGPFAQPGSNTGRPLRRPGSGGRSVGRGLSAALDYSRYAHGGDTSSDEEESSIFDQVDNMDPAMARAAAKQAMAEMRKEGARLQQRDAVERVQQRQAGEAGRQRSNTPPQGGLE